MNPEKYIAASLGQENLFITARGTSALWLALSVLEPTRRGVLVPANVCEVVIAAILFAGLEPIYVDVDPIIGNPDMRDLERAQYQDAGVLIAVHNLGTPLPIQDICSWARSHDMFVIEDACNALGATTQGYRVGELGDAAIYSFGGSKIVDIGHGGALATRDPSLLKACRRLEETLDSWGTAQSNREAAFQACLRTMRQHRELKDPALYRVLYQQYRPALVARAADGTGDLVAQALRNLSDNLELRQRRAEYYRARLDHPAVVHRPRQEGEVCWRYICHLPPGLRDGAVRYLWEQNLPASTWYPAVDLLFRERPDDCSLSGADEFERSVINLWVDPSTADAVIEHTSACLIEYLDEHKAQAQSEEARA